MKISVHNLTQNPTAAWKDLSKSQKVIKINVSPPKNEVTDNMVSLPQPTRTFDRPHKLLFVYFPFQVRFVCMSDTHSLTSHLKFDIPNGDIFIHAGDFTRCGGEEEVTSFSNWIGKVLLSMCRVVGQLFRQATNLTAMIYREIASQTQNRDRRKSRTELRSHFHASVTE